MMTDDVVLVRRTPPARGWDVCTHNVAQLSYPTYAEAEALALNHAEHAGVTVWCEDADRARLVRSFRRVKPGPDVELTLVPQSARTYAG